MEILDIDLNRYTNIVVERGWYSSTRNPRRYPELGDRDKGLEAAKESQISKRIEEVDQVRLKLTDGVQIKDPFLKAFLGPAARKIGPDNLARKIAVEVVKGASTELLLRIMTYLREEQVRIDKREKKKQEVKDIIWSEPRMFFVPEIGTRLRLTEDWEFPLMNEHRNSSVLKVLGKDAWTGYGNMNPVKLLEGSEIIVDRIYIRKGIDGYSSLTFRLQKGSRFEYAGATYPINSGRFWAKLRHVNRLKVQVDWNSVPGVDSENE